MYFRRELVEPRVYQEVIYARCKERNCLVVLPTGLGKTLIAMLIVDYRLSKYGGKVLFLAPTKPLAVQHAESFKRLFNLPQEKINVLTGELSPEKRGKLWEESVVITATPQTVENDILTGRISLEDVVLLVVDEAHRAVGSYSYVFIAKEYLKTAKHPLVLGLTASPGSDEGKIREIVQNLGIEHVEVRTESSPDVKPYVQRIAFEWVRVELPGIYKEVRSLLREMLKESLKPLAHFKLVSTYSPDISKREVLQAGSKINQEVARGNYEVGRLRMHQAKAIKLLHAIELLETQGLTALRAYLKKLREDKRAKSSGELMDDPRMRKVIYLLVQAKENGIDHPKMEKLKGLVREQLERKPNSKIIIFTNYRDTGRKIVEELRTMGISAERFIGQASRGKDRGMSQKEQKETLERFSRGEFSVLVATSVGEEGLDVPEVDLVVFYEPVPSAIRSIQRRGRTGRHRPGRVVVLMAKGTRDEAYYWSSKRKEKGMFAAIRKIARELEKEGPKEEKAEIREKAPESAGMERGKITPLDAFLKPKREERKEPPDANAGKEESPKAEKKEAEAEKHAGEVKELPIKPIFVRKPKGIVVYVDSRELRSGIPKLLKGLGVEVEVRTLDVADYVVSEEVGIERKSANDFIQSIIDGRLFDQVERLKKAYEKPVIIIEGELYGIRNVHPNAIRGAIAAVTLDWGVPILFSSGKEETASYIYLLAKREQEERKKEVRLRSEKKALTLAERQRLIVEGLPNVSATLAKRLLKHFGNVERVFTASEEELKEVEGIGEKKAREIRKVITAPYVEDEE